MNCEKKHQKLKALISIAGFCTLLFVCSCESPEYSFAAEELQMIDSLYKVQKDSVDFLMERECEVVYDKKYNKTVDSIKFLREREILDIISK